MKILIVDDEVLVRRSLSRAFQSRGHEIFEAEDGELGLKAWIKHQPELVMLDVLMPKLTGPQVLKELGNRKTGKVILMSAYGGDHNIQTSLEMGADLFIAKPFENIFDIVKQAEEILASK